MLHMKLVWRVVKSNLGYVVETAAGSGGPLFHICQVGSCLCNDDDGHNTAVAIAEEHNAALKQELLAAHRERWLSELPDLGHFFVTNTGFTIDKLQSSEKNVQTKLCFSSGELLAYESTTYSGDGERVFFVNLKGEAGFAKGTSLAKLINDGVIAQI